MTDETGTTTAPADDTTTATSESVPYQRFAGVIAERNQLQADLATATTAAGEVAELQQQIEALKTEHAAQTATWESDRGLMSRGLMDEEARDVARLLHGRLPADDRPKIGAWLDTMTADGATVPKALAGYLAAPATTTAPAATTAPPAVKLPASNSGATGAAPAATQILGVDKLRSIREECLRTGDWSPYQAIRDQLLQSLKK